MQDYRNEVKEFFSGDEQLASEIEFVLKTAEKEREMLEQMNTCSLAGDAKTPKAQGSVQGSPVRSRPLQPFNFATLQPPRLNFQAARLSLTHCVRRSRKMSSLNRSL